MADITQTQANVRAGADAQISTIIAGEALGNGQIIYKKSADSKGWQADATVAAEAQILGVTVGYADADGKVPYQTSGLFKPGGTVVPNVAYGASKNGGGAIAPLTDLIATQYMSQLGIGVTTTEIEIKIHNTGNAVP